jgi:hypothetical protein
MMAPTPGQERPATPASQVLRLRFDGANPAAPVAGVERLPGVVNYLRGNDPTKSSA